MITPISIKFIKTILEDNERMIAGRRLHWMHLLSGVFWFIFFSTIGISVNYFVWKYAGQHPRPYVSQYGYFRYSNNFSIFMWFCIFTGTMSFLIDFIRYKTTVVILTSKRLIYKVGTMHVKIDETDLSDIRAVHVDQGWLGHILGYGKVHMDCRFVEDIYLPYIRHPYGLVKAVHEMRSDAVGKENIIRVVSDDDNNNNNQEAVDMSMPLHFKDDLD